MNQHQLRVMGVGHPALDTICNFCAEHGFAAKLTGAGGGGCAFVLLTKGIITSTASQMIFIQNGYMYNV